MRAGADTQGCILGMLCQAVVVTLNLCFAAVSYGRSYNSLLGEVRKHLQPMPCCCLPNLGSF